MQDAIEINDFSYYWVATKLLLANGNPYQLAEFVSLQNTYNIYLKNTLQFNYPPWSLNWFILLAILTPLEAFTVWKVFNVFILIICALLVYDIICKINDSLIEKSYKLLITSLAIVFFAYADFLWSNSNFLVLFGLLLYFRYTHQFQNSKLSALGLSLVIIKPNLLLAFLSYAFFSAIRRKDKNFIIYFIGSLCLQISLPIVLNPNIYTHYLLALPKIVQESSNYSGFSIAPLLKYFLPFQMLSYSLLLVSVLLGALIGLRFNQKMHISLSFIPISLLLSPHTIFTSALLMFPCIVLKLNTFNKCFIFLNLILFAITITSSTLAKDSNIIMLSFYSLMILSVHQIFANRREVSI